MHRLITFVTGRAKTSFTRIDLSDVHVCNGCVCKDTFNTHRPVSAKTHLTHIDLSHCITLHHTVSHNTLYHSASHCITLHHTASHCNTPHHTATHCITRQHTVSHRTAPHCITPQHIASHRNTLHHITLPSLKPQTSTSAHSLWYTSKMYFSSDLVVQIKQMWGYRV